MGIIERIYADTPTPNELGGAITVVTGEFTIQMLISRVISWLLYFAGVIAFIYLVISGLTYITAGGNAEQAKKGQQGIINAAIGIIVIVLSFAILQAAQIIGNKNAPERNTSLIEITIGGKWV